MRDMVQDDGRLGLRNILLSVLAGVLSAAAMWWYGVPGLDPSLWGETAVSAGIYPPWTIFPGFWRILTRGLFTLLGVEGAVAALRIVGVVVAGGCVALVGVIARQMLALVIRTGHIYAAWHRRIAPFFAFVAALCFGLSDPLWRISRVFSPDELRLALFLFIVHLSLRWFVVGGRRRIFPAMALMGVMAAETPFAFLLPLVFVGAYMAVWHCIMDNLFPKPEKLPEPEELPKWRMLFLFLGGLALAAWANAAHFMSIGGLEANGWQEADIYFRYAAGYWHVMTSASSLVGWMLGICFGVLPFLVALRVAPLVIRDDTPMRFDFGVILFFVGAMSVMQCGAFPSGRFWTFVRDVPMVESGFLLTFFVFLAMLALALFGAAFAFECQRTYLDEDEPKPRWLLRATVPLLTLGLLALVAMNVPKPVETEMQRIVDDAIKEIVDECGDAKWLFTDGRLDPGIELRAAVEGKTLRPLNMMSGSSEWELAVRRRGFAEGSEDLRSVETGVPVLMRVWAGEKPNGLDEAALQLGFEYWQRDRKPLPRLSGLVGRTTGLDEATAKEGVERARSLSARVLAISSEQEKADPSPALASAFSAVNWRLARFARLREEESLAQDLDLSNGALKKLLSLMEYERLHTFLQMTPREGLQLALRRADFAEARRFSAAVLRNDEDDPEANFGMGMAALKANDLKNAEHYLRQCLKRRPDEPAVLNNLSIICRKFGRYDEAVKLARKALERLPDSPEVKQTLSDALKKAP